MVLITIDGETINPDGIMDSAGRIVIQGTNLVIGDYGAVPFFDVKDHTIPVYAFSTTFQKGVMGVNQSVILTLNCTNNADSGDSLIVDITIPTGLTLLKSETNEGIFNSSTGKWTISLVNQTASLALLLQPNTTGNQTITAILEKDSTTLNTTCNIASTDTGAILDDDVNLASLPSGLITLANMKHGEIYTLISYNTVTDGGVSGIYNGVRNNCLSVINGIETIGSRITSQGQYQKNIVVFIYDETNPVIFKRYGQYTSVSTSATVDDWAGYCLNEGYNLVYSESTNLLSNPQALYTNGVASNLILSANSSSAEYVFTTPVIEAPTDLNSFFTGILINLNSFNTVSSVVEIWFESETGNISNTKTVPIIPDENIPIGNMSDLWDLTSDDIINQTIDIHLIITNVTLNTQTYSFNDLELILYWLDDTTNGARAFTIDGIHLRTFQGFMKNANNPFGTKPALTTLDVQKTDGKLITNMDMDLNDLSIEFIIDGDTIEDAYSKLSQISNWITNKRLSSRKPVLKNLIFDAIPNLVYPYVLSDAISVIENVTSLDCKFKVSIPGGCGVSINPVITGAIGSNTGNVEVFPLITILADGSTSIVITENISGDVITLNSQIAAGTLVYFDCANMKITDINGVDYTLSTCLDSVFPLCIIEDYNFTVTGGKFQTVLYYPGY
jgi:hypothetical protein